MYFQLSPSFTLQLIYFKYLTEFFYTKITKEFNNIDFSQLFIVTTNNFTSKLFIKTNNNLATQLIIKTNYNITTQLFIKQLIIILPHSSLKPRFQHLYQD